MPSLRPQRRAELAARWDHASGGWLFASAMVFVVAFTARLLWPEAPPPAGRAADVLLVVSYVPFIVDYGVRLTLAERRWSFVLRHPLDLLVLLVPVLRSALVVIAVLVFGRGLLAGRRHLADRFLLYALSVSFVLCLFSGALIVMIERSAPNAELTTLSDGLWWSFVTIATVGYGDVVPVTTAGRIVGVLTMFVGIGLLGAITATLSSVLVSAVGSPDVAVGGIDDTPRGEVPRGSVFPDASAATTARTETGPVVGAGTGTTAATGPLPSTHEEADLTVVLAEIRALRAEVGALRARLDTRADGEGRREP